MVHGTAAERLAGIDPRAFKPDEQTPQQKCEARGGTWNQETFSCEFPKPEPTPEQTPNPPSPPGTVVRNAETGEVSGFINAEGNFVSAGKEDVANILQKRQEATAPLPGEVSTEQFQQQQRTQQQIGQIGQIGQLTQAQEAEINFSQAITAGLARVVPAAVGGAAVGAAAGVVGSAGVLSLPAAGVVGAAAAVGGFVSGVLSNIKEQQRGELSAASEELTNGLRSMRQLAMLASQDPQNADVYIQQFNQVLTRIHQSRRQTKAEVSGDLNAFMEDGREQLADFDVFLQPGGLADIYGQKLAISLQTGVPLSINGEELFFER